MTLQSIVLNHRNLFFLMHNSAIDQQTDSFNLSLEIAFTDCFFIVYTVHYTFYYCIVHCHV